MMAGSVQEPGPVEVKADEIRDLVPDLMVSAAAGAQE
jgi:hypothetical protein